MNDVIFIGDTTIFIISLFLVYITHFYQAVIEFLVTPPPQTKTKTKQTKNNNNKKKEKQKYTHTLITT